MWTHYGEDLSVMLPTKALHRGWGLYEFSMVPTVDPIHLRDKHGQVLHEWYYVPSLTELFEVCEQLQRSEGER